MEAPCLNWSFGNFFLQRSHKDAKPNLMFRNFNLLESPLKRGEKGVCKFAITHPQPLFLEGRIKVAVEGSLIDQTMSPVDISYTHWRSAGLYSKSSSFLKKMPISFSADAGESEPCIRLKRLLTA